MSSYKWILEQTVLAIHDEQIAEHGGGGGIRDITLLQSALARPENQAYYKEGVGVSELAASYAVGLAKNHPFVDGNKRTAFVVMELFLMLNGYELTADDATCVLTMLKVAAGDLSEDELALWIKDHITAR